MTDKPNCGGRGVIERVMLYDDGSPSRDIEETRCPGCQDCQQSELEPVSRFGPAWTDASLAALGLSARVCFSCDHWQNCDIGIEPGDSDALNRLLVEEGSFHRECRRFPPSAADGWPETGFTDCCGEYRQATYFADAANNRKDGPHGK